MSAATATRIPLAEAAAFAAKIAGAFAPHCDQVEVAGSIRRRRPDAGDIDIVCLPSSERDRAAIDRLLAERCRATGNGVQVYEGVHIATGYRIDVWFARPAEKTLLGATPGNFGSLLLCRTGSARHNIRLVDRAKSLGLRWHPHLGVFDASNGIVAAEREIDIFDALDLEFIEPEDRE